MSALDPIAGISLERYADLCAKMKDCGGDLEVCARIAEQNGVDRATWQAAMDGWNQRMADPMVAGEVALAYMPLFQEALARNGSVTRCSFEDYIGMSVMVQHPDYGLDKMYAHYGLDVYQWSQISDYWFQQFKADLPLGERFSDQASALMERMKAGAPPPPPGLGEKPAS